MIANENTNLDLKPYSSLRFSWIQESKTTTVKSSFCTYL
jgi:hypothetical protein